MKMLCLLSWLWSKDIVINNKLIWKTAKNTTAIHNANHNRSSTEYVIKDQNSIIYIKMSVFYGRKQTIFYYVKHIWKNAIKVKINFSCLFTWASILDNKYQQQINWLPTCGKISHLVAYFENCANCALLSVVINWLLFQHKCPEPKDIELLDLLYMTYAFIWKAISDRIAPAFLGTPFGE